MLETVKNDLTKISLDRKTFNKYFTEYVIQVQDSNIDSELSYLMSHNVVSVQLLDRAITDAFKGMIDK